MQLYLVIVIVNGAIYCKVSKYVAKHFKTWNHEKNFNCNRKISVCLHVVFV